MHGRSWVLVAGVTAALGGCASSAMLLADSEAHLSEARQAAARGDAEEAAREQRRAFRLYEKAVVRAYEEGRPAPTPPGPPVYPERTVF